MSPQKKDGSPPPTPRRHRTGPPPIPPKRRPAGKQEKNAVRSEPQTSAGPPPRGSSSGSSSIANQGEFTALLNGLRAFFSVQLEDIESDSGRPLAILAFELGALDELVFGDSERALGYFKKSSDADPSFIPAIRALRRHLGQEQRWSEALALKESEIALTADESERSAQLAGLGQMIAARTGDADAAVERLEQAIRLVPNNRLALELIRALRYEQQQWEPLLGVIRQLATITTDERERARFHVEMAEVCEFRLGRSEQAEEFYAHGLTLDPQNEKATLALRRLYLAHGQWGRLQELLTTEAGREHEPEQMYADMYRAGRLAEVRLGDDSRAASLLETASALQPRDLLPLLALADVYRRSAKYEELASVLSRQLELQRDPAARAELYFRLGRLEQGRLQRPEHAVVAYRKALAERPGHEASLGALAALYEQQSQWSELYDVELHRAERHHDDRLRAVGYLRAAALCEAHLDDTAQARLLYERSWRLVPSCAEAFRALDRIYRQQEQWEPLVDLYEQRAQAHKDPFVAASLWRGAAGICEERLGAAERAIVAMETVRTLIPDDREALIQLARLYERTGRYEKLERVLELWVRSTGDLDERVELWRRLGDLNDGPLRRSDQAIAIYQEILGQSPNDRATHGQLKRVLERLGRWDELLKAMSAELEVVASATERASLTLEMGRIFEEKLGDLDGAQRAYEQALGLDSGFAPALLALEELLRQREGWQALAALSTGRAEEALDLAVPNTAAVFCVAAEIHETHLEDPQGAERLFNQALSLDPTSWAAAQGLERIYLLAGDYPALEGHYLREAEGTQNPVLRARAYFRLASVFEASGENEHGAIAAYESALKVLPDHPEALASLTSLCRRLKKSERLASLLGRVAATAEDRDAAVVALKEWASLVEVEFAGRWDPEPIYRRVLDGDPLDAHAMFALDSLAQHKGDRQALLNLAVRQAKSAGDSALSASLCVRAALILVPAGKLLEAAEALRRGLRREPTYLPALRLLRSIDERTEQWEEAAEMLLREADLVAGQEARHLALCRAGSILLDRFSDQEGARGLFERVFDEDPQSGAAFGRLAEILAAEDSWSDLARFYERRMAVVEPAARIPLQLQLAALHRDHLGDASRAVEVLADLLATEERHVGALFSMSELCVQEQRWREAEGYLARLADASPDPQQQRQALLDRSDVLDARLGEQDEALAVLDGVLVGFPEDIEALRRCIAVYRRRADWPRTVELVERLVTLGSSTERVSGLVGLAEIYSRSMGDPVQAAKALARAAHTCAETGEGIPKVTQYFERRGDYAGLVELFGEALARLPPEGSPGVVALRLARARIFAGRLLQPTDAEAEIVKALRVAPQAIDARLELAGLHFLGDNFGEAAAHYLKVLDQDAFSVEAFRGLYRVFERRGDCDRAAGLAQAVSAVGKADDGEKAAAAGLSSALSESLGDPEGPALGREGYWQVLAHREEPEAARELLVAAADHLPLIYPEEIHNARGGAFIPLDPEHELAMRCQDLARPLGVESVEICLGQSDVTSVIALPGPKARLVLGEQFADGAQDAVFRFAVGRALAHTLVRTSYLRVLGPERLSVFMAALVEVFDRGSGAYLAGGSLEVEGLARQFTKAIPRRARRLLEPTARAYGAAGAADFRGWADVAERGAERAGLLLAGDLPAVMKQLAQEKRSRRVQAGLLRFAAGPHLYEARRRLGFGV